MWIKRCWESAPWPENSSISRHNAHVWSKHARTHAHKCIQKRVGKKKRGRATFAFTRAINTVCIQIQDYNFLANADADIKDKPELAGSWNVGLLDSTELRFKRTTAIGGARVQEVPQCVCSYIKKYTFISDANKHTQEVRKSLEETTDLNKSDSKQKATETERLLNASFSSLSVTVSSSLQPFSLFSSLI